MVLRDCAPCRVIRLDHDPAGAAARLPRRRGPGRRRAQAPVGRPGHTGDVVAEVLLAEPGPSSTPAGRRAAQPGWAATPAPVRGGSSSTWGGWWRRTGRPWPAWSPGRSASRWPSRAARSGDRRHLRLLRRRGRRLYGQTVPSEMPDKQLFTFRQPVGVAAVITAGNFPVAVPSWYLVPALLCGNAVVWKPAECARHRRGPGPAVLARRPARRRAQPGPGRRPGHLRGAGRRPGGRPGRQGRLHRLDRGRAAHRRALRTPPPGALPGAGRQEPAGGDARRRPRPGRRGALFSGFGTAGSAAPRWAR